MLRPPHTLLLGFFVILLGIGGLLLAQRPRVLIVNGKNAGPATLTSRGRTYVDVETLAQALNGSVTLQPDRVILNLPGVKAADVGTEETSEAMSREFAGAALGALALMRDWRVAIATMISQQLPATGYFQDFRDRAQQGLQQTGVVASTDSDHEAYQLLQAAFGNLERWSDFAISRRQALNATDTMRPDVLQRDQDLQRITDCSNRLSAILVSRQYADVPSCR